MQTRFLSRFTPSLMTPDALEAIFVQRESLLKSVLDGIRKSVQTRSSFRALLIGPRGLGKTHFVSLTYHRVRAMADLQQRLLVAWLREEEWGVTCFRDLLVRILRSLPNQISDGGTLEKQIEGLHLIPLDRAEATASEHLKQLTGARTLLLLVENLDDLFQRLGPDGQRRFHSFMTANPSFCLVATSPTSFGDFLRPGAIFHKFFHVHQLEQLSIEDATQLISKIARYEGNESLDAFIKTPRGRARLRALRYLAGGNHRAYVIFSRLLARESLEELMGPLMQTIDDLTPYYHSRIAALTPEQRKIIEFVCETRHPVQVADVARGCFLPASLATRHLGLLTQTGHLQALCTARDTYYELREPLMRLSIEVKKHRGKPLRLLMDFLRLWYSPAELRQRLSSLPNDAEFEREHALPALEGAGQDWEDPRVPECCKAYNDAVVKGDYDRAAQAAEELVTIRGHARDMFAHASCLVRLGQCEQAVAAYDKIIGQAPREAEAWQLRASALCRLGRFEEALQSCDQSIELDSNSGRTWCLRGSVLFNLDRLDDSIACCERAIRLNPKDAAAWTTRGKALADLGCHEDAAAAFTELVHLEPENPMAHSYLSAALVELKRHDEALAEGKRAARLDSQNAVPWVLQGCAFMGLDKGSEALKCFDRAIELGNDSSLVHFKRVQLLFALGRWREGAACLDSALGRFAHCENPDAGNTTAILRNLLSTGQDSRIARLCIKLLVLLYRKNKVLSALGQGLIECIPEATSREVCNDTTARIWLESWKSVTVGLPELRLPLRLLEFATRYRETADECVLMDLPQEERAILEPILGIHLQETA